MSRRILVRPRAQQDLDEHFAFIAHDSPDAALPFLDAVRAAFEQLATWPELGGKWEFRNLRLVGIRVSLVRGFENHLVFYAPTEQDIEIIRVLHGARDIDAAFEYDR